MNKELEKYDALDCGYCEHENVPPKAISADNCVEYQCPNCDELWAIDQYGDIVE